MDDDEVWARLNHVPGWVAQMRTIALSVDRHREEAARCGHSCHEIHGGVQVIHDGVAMMVFDAPTPMARVHLAGWFDDVDEDEQGPLGVRIVASAQSLKRWFDHWADRLLPYLGAPSNSVRWSGSFSGYSAPFEFEALFWRGKEAQVVLLLNEEGDAHVGEIGTVDVRLVPLEGPGAELERVLRPIAFPVAESKSP